MICPNCNAYAGDDEIVCSRCGTLLTRVSEEEDELMRYRQGRHRKNHSAPVQESGEKPRRRRSASRPMEEIERPAPSSDVPVYGAEDVAGMEGLPPLNEAELYPDALARRARLERPSRLEERYEDSYVDGEYRGKVAKKERIKTYRADKYMTRQVNWTYVAVAAAVLMVMLLFGAYLFLTKTSLGQVYMARMGRDATSAALWQVGEEKMNRGDIAGAIEDFNAAKDKEGKDDVNVVGLLQLGSAYEADGQLDMAEEIYAFIYTDIVPTATEAYKNQVRILLEQGRKKDATELLNKAYEMTGEESFRTQRTNILPPIPGANVTAGYYTEKKTISFAVADEYTVYYTTNDNRVLPEEGTLYEGAFELGEGEHHLRAVTVSEDGLVSDEMKGTYQIYMPTPLQPDTNLAPNTYQKQQKVRLRPGVLTAEQLVKNPGYAATLKDEVAQTITIYYTIDGSDPDADSPTFDYNDPDARITLPGGSVTLKAISVNGYQKQSTIKEVGYYFQQKPYPKSMMSTDDVLEGLKLGVTTRETFARNNGDPVSVEKEYSYVLGTELEKYVYDWGYASFNRVTKGWVLVDVRMTTNVFKAPRNTKIGSTEDEVVGQFRDYGQVAGASGSRGLYESTKNSVNKGKIYVEDGKRIIRYRVQTGDSHVWQMEYELDENKRVEAIRWFYEP